MTHHTTQKGDIHTAPDGEARKKTTPDRGFSVLMAVYHGEHHSHFRDSIESIFHQTLMPSEIILVCDGPLNDNLDAIIEQHQSEYPEILKVIRLPENRGLGNALNKGIEQCSYEIIARMDADDVAYANRFEEQINYMYQHPDIDVLSCAIDEFRERPDKIVSKRLLPEKHEDLVKYARKRCPVNHPSVVFRRSAVQKAGNYQHFFLFEDYLLWARMIMNGAKFHSLPESLLYFRMDENTYSRRKGWKYIQSEMKLQKKFLKMGFTNRYEYVRNICLRVPPRLLSTRLLSLFYRCFLRSKK
ncbi:glycosyltransferase [Porphyromonas circumdentaria]|uniref:glycosyltransferase n=1 Tax=Porphyromonas circumdentaria TaxID=29524 RepID=UPI0026DA8D45|nr:glycosyltransferase [Porphyromonas circumdentaria]MDO4722545.1 glycosyltransferase [Porphyromonas circumdentaria]